MCIRDSFYWMHETNYRSSLIRYASEKAQTLGYPMLWIPFYNASGWNRGGDMGLSAVALQPNHFFPSGGPSQDRIRDAAALAKMYGLGKMCIRDRNLHDYLATPLPLQREYAEMVCKAAPAVEAVQQLRRGCLLYTSH